MRTSAPTRPRKVHSTRDAQAWASLAAFPCSSSPQHDHYVGSCWGPHLVWDVRCARHKAPLAKGPIPPIREKCPAGTKGVGRRATKWRGDPNESHLRDPPVSSSQSPLHSGRPGAGIPRCVSLLVLSPQIPLRWAFVGAIRKTAAPQSAFIAVQTSAAFVRRKR